MVGVQVHVGGGDAVSLRAMWKPLIRPSYQNILSRFSSNFFSWAHSQADNMRTSLKYLAVAVQRPMAAAMYIGSEAMDGKVRTDGLTKPSF